MFSTIRLFPADNFERLHQSAEKPDTIVLKAGVLREMQIEDLGKVFALMRRVSEISLLPEETPENYQAVLKRNVGFCKIVTDHENNQVLGCSFAGHNGIRGIIHHVTVAPEARGQGLGRKMVESTLPHFTTDNNGMVGVNNEVAKAFWRTMGFRHSTPEDQGAVTLMTIDL